VTTEHLRVRARSLSFIDVRLAYNDIYMSIAKNLTAANEAGARRPEASLQCWVE